MIRISELRDRDVVNVNDGRRLGLIGDLELDLEKGQIKAVIIPASAHLLKKIVRPRDYVIPWERIIKIGVDTILVDFQENRPSGTGD